MYKLLEKWAADEFRSVNGQLEWIIHQQLKAAGRLGKEDREKKEDMEKKADKEKKKDNRNETEPDGSKQ